MKKFPVSHPEMVQGMKSYLYTRKCIFIFNRVKIQHVLVLTVKNSSTHQKIIISARNLASVKKCNEQWASDASRGGGMAEQEIMLKKQKEIILTEWFYRPCISYTDLQKSQLSKQQEYQG